MAGVNSLGVLPKEVVSVGIQLDNALLALAMAWSLWLGWRVSAALPGWRRAVPVGALLLGNALIGYGWWLQFWGW